MAGWTVVFRSAEATLQISRQSGSAGCSIFSGCKVANYFSDTQRFGAIYLLYGMRILFFLRKEVILCVIPKLKNVLVRTIKHYLSRHKRLVVPQLGAFIVKEPGGGVLFSELLRRDDGVLRGLLREEGMSDLEAAGAIDRFAFEVRHAVQEGAEYPMDGFGRFRSGPNGTLAFVHEPDDGVAGRAAEAASAGSGLRPDPAPVQQLSEAPAEAGEAPRAAAHPISSKIEPDPSLKGLRYGKPRRTTDAYTYVERRGQRKADRFLLLAIIAAVIAVAAIAFGWYVTRSGEEPERVEMPAAVETPAGGADEAFPDGGMTQTSEE